MGVNWTIDVGHILILMGMVTSFSLWLFVSGKAKGIEDADAKIQREALKAMREDIRELKNMQKQITELLLQIAVQQNTIDGLIKRIEILDQRVEDLRHLKGFIVPERIGST